LGLSIRWRLTLWITLALAAVLLGFSALVYAMLSHALYERVDHSLLSVLQELESKTNPDLPYWIKEAKEHNNMACVVYDSQGNVHERTEELSSQRVPAKPDRNGLGRSYADMTLPSLGHQRTLHTAVTLKGRELTVLLLAGREEGDCDGPDH